MPRPVVRPLAACPQVWLRCLIALFLLHFLHSAHAAVFVLGGKSGSRPLNIKVLGDAGWGSARPAEIEAVLASVAEALIERLPPHLQGATILVSHAADHPVTLFEKGPQGEYQVQLSATDRRWAQFTYQFAHELAHILSNYDAPGAVAGSKANQWFEETLCETASLYTLRKLARVWRESPPWPALAGYADSMAEYARRLLAAPHRRQAAHIAPDAWLAENERSLRSDPYQRARNEVLATRLLPLFEAQPELFQALPYLNLSPDDSRVALRDYLANWQASAPDAQRPVLRTLRAQLGMGGTQTPPALAGDRDPAVVAR